MDNDIAIKISHVSKIYEMYDKPIDRLKEALSFGRRNYHKDFYALNDINLEIKKGETVGIIGKNGAGKSTLLKIITGVLTPTCGEVQINGKISSLLELGAGFNPDFTGIENVYLNGSIMGYTKEEMDERLQSILDFADIGDFVYQPVKTYSSGMYVRLAFSVAINVDPDILIVDEALAVGDARFQYKCFGKLELLRQAGTTLLFVSHAMDNIKQLCNKAVLMKNGCIDMIGLPNDVCIEYFKQIFPTEETFESVINDTEEIGDSDNNNILDILHIDPTSKAVNKFGCGGVIISNVDIIGIKNKELNGGEEIKISMQVNLNIEDINILAIENKVKKNLILGVSFADINGNYIFGMTTYDKNIMLSVDGERDCFKVYFKTIFPYLKNGDYAVNVACALGTQENHIQLQWCDCIEIIKMISKKKYVYGLIYNEYEAQEM